MKQNQATVATSRPNGRLPAATPRTHPAGASPQSTFVSTEEDTRPIDFSAVSVDALPYAAFLATHFGAEVILLHVLHKFPIDYLLGRDLMNHTIVPLMKQAEADLKRMEGSLSEAVSVNVSAAIRDGKPYEETCRAARTLGADLTLLTTHGYTGLKHVVLGSRAERVVRHADCPVLVGRDQARFGRGKRSASPRASS